MSVPQHKWEKFLKDKGSKQLRSAMTNNNTKEGRILPERPQVVIIGDERYLIDNTKGKDEEGEEEYIGAGELPEVDEGELLENREEFTTPTPIKARFPDWVPDPPGTIRLCRNDRCGRVVEPPPHPNIKKIYCSPECGHRYAQRIYAAKKKGGGQTLEKFENYQMQFHRNKPKDIKTAEFRYHHHIERGTAVEHNCPNATLETLWNCPATFYGDFYSKEQRCLIYATFVDDMKELWALRDDRYYIRQFTTNDGRWIAWTNTEALLTHMDEGKGEVPPEVIDPRMWKNFLEKEK